MRLAKTIPPSLRAVKILMFVIITCNVLHFLFLFMIIIAIFDLMFFAFVMESFTTPNYTTPSHDCYFQTEIRP